jgi:hypothetical protein
MKIQSIHSPNGIAMDISDPFPGSIHDKRIFDECGTMALFESKEWKESICNNVMYFGIFDSGYMGINHYMDAILPIKKKPNSQLEGSQREFNFKINSYRVIVENYYCRLGAYFNIMKKQYRLSLSFFKNISEVCFALTNILILKHPMRKERSVIIPEDKEFIIRTLLETGTISELNSLYQMKFQENIESQIETEPESDEEDEDDLIIERSIGDPSSEISSEDQVAKRRRIK